MIIGIAEDHGGFNPTAQLITALDVARAGRSPEML